jgi:hypothetical protein
VDAERSDLRTSHPELCTQLTKNLLIIPLQYLCNESKADVYFDQSILNAAFNESQTKVEAEIDPGVSEVVFSNITKATVSLTIENKDTVALNFGFVANETDPLLNISETEVEQGSEKSILVGRRRLDFGKEDTEGSQL